MRFMRRRDFVALLGTAATWPLGATAQEAGRTYRLGGIYPRSREVRETVALFDELRRRGFVEDQDLIIDWLGYGLNIDSVPGFAAKLVRSQVDVILAGGNLAIRAAQQVTTTIPILGITDDMVGSRLVGSLSRPGGNTTGVSILATELDGKRQEILIEAVPGLRRMAALADSNTTTSPQLQALQDTARIRRVELSVHRIARAEEIATGIDSAKASGAAALNVLASPILYSNRAIIMRRVAALRMPTIYQWPEAVEEGGFIAYGPSLVQLFGEIVARQMVKLLHGTKPADTPVEQPTRFELAVNVKTAEAIGYEIPAGLVARADKVIG